jgi:Skp family chaperone for outer membrane proteins
MYIRAFSAALFVLVIVAPSAHADFKIATVDVSRILNESPDAVSKKKELDTLTQDAKKKAESKRKELDGLRIKLESAKVSEDSKEAESLRAQVRDYARFVKDAEEDIKKRYVKVNRDITEKAMGRIESYAKANDIDLVLDKSDKYRSAVLFGDSGADITDDILGSR